MKKIDVKFVLKGLTYVGLIIMIIIMMIIASSCSAEPKPEMTQEEASNLSENIREKNTNDDMLEINGEVSLVTLNNMKTAAAADNYLSSYVGSYIALNNITEFFFMTGISDYGFTNTSYSDGSSFSLITDYPFGDVIGIGWNAMYGYLVKDSENESTYLLIGCIPIDSSNITTDGGYVLNVPNYLNVNNSGETITEPITENTDPVVEETTAAVDPELTDPSTHPSDLSKCFVIDMYAQSEADIMALLEDHLGEWVHLYNLNTTSPESGTNIMYAYVGTENIGGGNANLQIAGEGGYLNLALADGLTDEFYGFVGIDGMTQEIYIGNIFAANEDTLCSDPTGPDGEPPSDWTYADYEASLEGTTFYPASDTTTYLVDDIMINKSRFLGEHEGNRIHLEGTVTSISDDSIYIDDEIYVEFSNVLDIWLFNEGETITVDGLVEYDVYLGVTLTDAYYLRTVY